MFPFGLWKKDEVSSSNEVAKFCQSEEVTEVCSDEEVMEVCPNNLNINVAKASARGLASGEKKRFVKFNKSLLSLLSTIENALEKEYGSIAQFPKSIEKQIEKSIEECTESASEDWVAPSDGRLHISLLTIHTSLVPSSQLIDEIDKVDLSDYPRFCMIRKSPDIVFSTYGYNYVTLEANQVSNYRGYRLTF